MNRNTSSIVAKAGFDLAMALLARSLYCILANGLDGFGHCAANTIYNKSIRNAGAVEFDCCHAVAKLKEEALAPLADRSPC